MKRVKLLSTLVAFSVMLAGCASSANPQTPAATTAASGTTGTAAPAAKSNLTVAYSEGGTTLDPAEANDLTSDTLVLAAYDQLVTYGIKTENGASIANTEDIQPMLAESWEVNADNTVYTFKLKSGVSFQSGNPVDAESVAYSFDRVAKSSSGSFLYGMANIKSVAVKDASTVEVTLTNANHNFLQILAMYTFSIVDQKTVEAQGADYLKTNAAGSGRSRLRSGTRRPKLSSPLMRATGRVRLTSAK